MKIITRQHLANGVLERWSRQYPGDRFEKTEKIKSLGVTPNPNEIDELIGNGSWTRLPCCAECGAGDLPVVQMGDPEKDIHFCRHCLEKAIAL